MVSTTLDLDLQHDSIAILERWIREFENQSGSHNGATIAIDPKTGEILAMVGSRDYFSEDILGKNNNLTALNSPGSSFKPFVYMSSFIKLGWGPGTYILDSPVSYKQQDGTDFVPTNPNKNFQGLITLRNALGNSLNIPANKVADATGIEFVVQMAKKMGFTTFTGSYGPAIATGGVDITAIDQAYAYSVIANGGVMRGMTPLVKHRTGERNLDPIAILKVDDSQKRVRFDVAQRRGEERIVKEEYTYLISSILSDGSAQCITFGCGGITVPGRQVGVKTGTSEPFDPKGRDAGKIGETWTFAYSPDFVVGIWAGNSDNTPIAPNIYSTSIAFRAARDTLVTWYDGRPGTAFRRPETVVEETVCVPSGLKPTPLCGKTTKDLFAKDNVPTQDDNMWQRVRIDGRTGLLASAGTPAQFVQEQVMLVLPAEFLKTEDLKKAAQEWADALGIPLAPTEVSPATGAPGTNTDLPALIFTPAPGQTVTGLVPVNGRASSTTFVSYRLEYGQGAAPATWTPIQESTSKVESGPLGIWNVQALPPGLYTLRLVVTDRTRGQMITTVTVNAGPPGTPIASPTAPPRP